jgi:predicted glycoside hydrolase/deacetylase ChbG (UPF0249 family)
VLHADDAGLSPEINQAILELVQQEKLTSISVISNAEYAAEFAESLNKLWPKISRPPQVFLHFNIIEGKPLTLWPADSNRIDSNGNFYFGYSGVVKALLKRKINPEVVRSELDAQYQKATDLGLNIVGIDSHQHMHALAPIAEVVREFAAQHNIKAIRSYDDMQTQTLIGAIKLALFRLLSVVTERTYYGRLRLPPAWHGHTWRKFVMTSWESISASKLKKDQIITCHPGSKVDRGFTPSS